MTTDYLGSVRMVTDANANVIARHDYLPFGEEILAGQAGRGSQWGAASPVNEKFTGQIRDQETGLDYFGARYLSAPQGRFNSPDDPFADQNPSDPQSWNLYSYVRSNPLNAIDPSGNDCITTSDQSDTRVTVTVASGSCEGNKGVYIPGTVDTSSLTYNGSSLTYSFAGDTASGAGTINFVSPQDSDDISPFGAAVIRSVGARTDASYKMMGAFAAGSVMAGATLAAFPAAIGETELTALGRIAPEQVIRPSPGQVAQMERLLAQQGHAGVKKALQTLEKRLAEHVDKIRAAKNAGGYTSSMDREVRNFRGLIEAAKQVLNR